MIVYLDASALVKRYLEEAGSDEVYRLFEGAEVLGTSLVTRAEVSAAFARAARLDAVSEEQALSARKDFEAEDKWFRENTPPAIRKRLSEAGMEITDRYDALGMAHPDPLAMCEGHCEGSGWFPVYDPRGDTQAKHRKRVGTMEGETDPSLIELWEKAELRLPSFDGWHFVRCPECKGTGLRISEFEKDSFNPTRSNDAQLSDDWRLMAAKFATLLAGGKTEFEDVEELESFATTLFKEIHKRGKMTFRPKDSKETSVELLRRVLVRAVKEGIILEAPNARDLLSGKATVTLYPRENQCFASFMLLVGDGRAYGFIRHHAGSQQKIKVQDAGRLEEKTGLNQQKINERFAGSQEIVAYEVRDIVPFKEPRPVGTREKADHIVPNVKLAEASPMEHVKSLSNLELIELHGRIHVLSVAERAGSSPFVVRLIEVDQHDHPRFRGDAGEGDEPDRRGDTHVVAEGPHDPHASHQREGE